MKSKDIFKGTKNQILCAINLGLCVFRTTVFYNKTIAKAIGIKFRNLEEALPSEDLFVSFTDRL